MINPRTVLISILNWNTAGMTVQCVESIFKMHPDPAYNIQLVVIDNGSAAEDWATLQQSLGQASVTLLRQEKNLGFAGGHNVAIRMAIERNADFIWLVNSDALLDPTSLSKLVVLMNADPVCGSVSPVIWALHDETAVDFCGARHDWKNLGSLRPSTIPHAKILEAETPAEMWLAGTVVMFRVAALAKVGGLDERLFAYFEDDDIGVRLARAGWTNRMAFDATAAHAQPNVNERRPHYFYLLYRNSFLFYLRYTPKSYRRLIRIRLLDRSLFTANRLQRKGEVAKADACLLGAWDGLLGRSGAPQLTRTPPLVIRALRLLFLVKQFRLIKHVDG